MGQRVVWGPTEGVSVLLKCSPAPELVCNRTFDKYSCWPDTPPNTTARISCPWYLPWYHKGDNYHGSLQWWPWVLGAAWV